MPYEGLVIFPESMQETDLDQAIGKVTGEVERLGGRMLGVERIGRKTFARPMRKREAGNYIRVGFELAPDKMADLNARYRLNEEIFRSQFVRVEAFVPRKEEAPVPHGEPQ